MKHKSKYHKFRKLKMSNALILKKHSLKKFVSQKYKKYKKKGKKEKKKK